MPPNRLVITYHLRQSLWCLTLWVILSSPSLELTLPSDIPAVILHGSPLQKGHGMKPMVCVEKVGWILSRSRPFFPLLPSCMKAVFLDFISICFCFCFSWHEIGVGCKKSRKDMKANKCIRSMKSASYSLRVALRKESHLKITHDAFLTFEWARVLWETGGHQGWTVHWCHLLEMRVCGSCWSTHAVEDRPDASVALVETDLSPTVFVR